MLHEYLFKASWRGTALRFYVSAKDETVAWDKARNQILRMQGGISCLDLVLLKHICCVEGEEQ